MKQISLPVRSQRDAPNSPDKVLNRMANSALLTSISILKVPTPHEIHFLNFAVTYRCNSQCSHCNIWKRYQDKPDDVHSELTLKQIEAMLNSSRCLAKLKNIALTGGEPFLRKDFVELYGLFANRYPDAIITIPTNAINPELVIGKLQEIARVHDSNKLYLSVSLDGMGTAHDKVRGMPNNYQNALNLLQGVKDILPLDRSGISFTITPSNHRQLYDVYRLSKQIHVGFLCQFAQKSKNYYSNTDVTFEWAPKELARIRKTIDLIIHDLVSNLSLIEAASDSSVFYYKKMVDFQSAYTRMPLRCFSGTHSVFIDPYGAVYPCIMLDSKMGNVSESPFDQIWLSKNAKNAREFIKNEKCKCWTPCETISSLNITAKFLLLRYLNEWTKRLRI